jgi:hypothetical protein
MIVIGLVPLQDSPVPKVLLSVTTTFILSLSGGQYDHHREQ